MTPFSYHSSNLSFIALETMRLLVQMRKFAITYSKKASQSTKRSQCELEKKLKELESNLNSEANFNEYTKCKNDLQRIYERIAEGVKIRSKCQWYQEGEKSTKFFLNLEKKTKKLSVKALVRKLEANGKEICDQAKINDEIKIFFEEEFKCHKGKSFINLSNILNSTDLPCLTNEQKDFCDIELGEKELLNPLKSMPTSKTPGNDGSSKEVYEAFWIELKNPFLKLFYHAKICKAKP